jgi:hypothetical protein
MRENDGNLTVGGVVAGVAAVNDAPTARWWPPKPPSTRADFDLLFDIATRKQARIRRQAITWSRR